MFRLPTRVHLLPGTRRELPAVLESLQARRVLLVTDAGVQRTPWLHEMHGLAEAHAHVEIDASPEPNPRAATVDALARRARRMGVHAVLGLGGGSVLDAAKAVAMLVNNDVPVATLEGRERFASPGVPFVAIPTTCGTGSEVTWVSVLSLPEQGRKMSVKGHAMFPHTALVDAELLSTLPPRLVASTGMDALTHALEALVVRPANPASTALATEAVRLILGSLESAVRGEPDALASVMQASTLAGMAFGNADVGAVHCLSESLGGLLDLPHGVLNGALVAPVLAWQRDTIAGRLGRLDERLGGAGDVDAMLERISSLARAVGMPCFSDLGVDPRLHHRIATMAAANGSNGSNTRIPQVEDYEQLLAQLAAS